MSQYKDQITGDVILDARVINGKLINNNERVYFNSNNYGNVFIENGPTSSNFIPDTVLKLQMGSLPYVMLKNLEKFTQDKYTISCWVWMNNLIDDPNCVYGFNISANTYNISDTSGYPQYRFYNFFSYNTAGKARIQEIQWITPDNNGTFSSEYFSSSTIPIKQWVHVAFVKNGTNVNCYINGTLYLSAPSSFNLKDKYLSNITIYCWDYTSSGKSPSTYFYYIDDIVFIKDQALWTSNFTPPNNYLTGDRNTNIKTEQILYPEPNVPTITGDILANVRTIGNKLVDISDYKVKNKVYWYNTQYGPIHTGGISSVSNTITKFSDTSLYQSGSYIFMEKNINNFNASKFTVSYWANPYYIAAHNTTSDTAMFWAGIALNDKDSASYRRTVFIAIDEKGSGELEYTHFNLRQENPTNYIITKRSRTSLIPLNQWYHYAFTYDGTTYKMYENGILVISVNSSEKLINNLYGIYVAAGRQEMQIYFDDIVLISDQILWEDEFVPPNMYLTGYEMPKRIHNSNILLPTNTEYNDYFDKAFLY